MVLGLYLARVSPEEAEKMRHRLESEFAEAWGCPPERVEIVLLEAVRKAFVRE